MNFYLRESFLFRRFGFAAFILMTTVFTQFVGLSESRADLEFLTCSFQSAAEHQVSCQSREPCLNLPPARARANPSWQSLVDNECLERKAHGCFCLTYLGGVAYSGFNFSFDFSFGLGQGAPATSSAPFNFSKWKLYGRYCGYRADLKDVSGGQLDWSNAKAVSEAYKKSYAIDPVDEVCRIHDIEYDRAPIDICAADERAVKSMLALAFDKSEKLSPSLRETAVVLTLSMKKNVSTCELLTTFKNWQGYFSTKK